jgi:hypothetical protein
MLKLGGAGGGDRGGSKNPHRTNNTMFCTSALQNSSPPPPFLYLYLFCTFYNKYLGFFFCVCRGPDINLNIKEELEDDDDMKCWTNGNDTEKSKSKQQLAGELVLRNILKEVSNGKYSEWEVVL